MNVCCLWNCGACETTPNRALRDPLYLDNLEGQTVENGNGHDETQASSLSGQSHGLDGTSLGQHLVEKEAVHHENLEDPESRDRGPDPDLECHDPDRGSHHVRNHDHDRQMEHLLGNQSGPWDHVGVLSGDKEEEHHQSLEVQREVDGRNAGVNGRGD